MREFKFELPSSDIKRFMVTEAMIDNPVEELRKLLSDDSENRRLIARELIREYERTFMNEHKIGLSFSDDAVNLIDDRAKTEGISIKLMCDKILEDYKHGLNLIKRNTGRAEFTITKEVIENPSATLDEWFRRYYASQPENA
jgi:hypothetical protein